MYSHNQSEDSNNDPDLIDSYFLPGGIFDPEDDEQLPDEKQEPEIQSRLERLAISNQTYDDRSHTHALDNRDSFGGQLLFHSQRNHTPQENSRIGVSALDPTADDVVGGNVGGRDLIMNVNPSTTNNNGPSLYNNIDNNDWFARQQSQQMSKQQGVHANSTDEQQQSEFAGLLRGAYHNNNGSRVPVPIGMSQYQHSSDFPKAHASFSSNSNGSHATSGGNASSSVKNGNPWSNQDLSSLKQMNSTAGTVESMQKSAIVKPPPQDNFRPPPGFSVGTHSSNNNTPASHGHGHGSQSQPSHSHLHSAPATSRHTHQHQHQHDAYIQQTRQQQQQPQQKQYLQTRSHTPTIPERRELKPEPVRDTMYPQSHHDDHPSKSQQHHQKQQIHSRHPQSPTPNSPRKKHHDDDLNSLNTIKSRDVPSTIYVEEDAVSTSEDTLTVCADSVTDASVSVRTTKVEKEERMDVVEETSNDQTKPKRNRKKKSKSKKQQQKGAKAVEETKEDYSFHEDEALDVATSIQKEEESEESSKQTRKPKKFYKKPTESKAQYATSRSSDTTTAMSSAATTVHRKTTSDKHHRSTEKKTRHEKPPPPPREPLSAIIMKHIRSFIPIAISAFLFSTKLMVKASKGVLSYSISLFPKKERFWFIFPICCISIDIFFLILSGLCKLCGHFLYCMVLVHKLAVIELMESDYVTLCYSTIFFYPKLVDAFKASFTYQDYWPVLVRWIILNQWFCRPITMKDTFLYKLKKKHEKDRGAMDVMKRSLIGGDPVTKSLKNTVDHIVRKSKEDELEESERVIMANQILSIIRKAIPLILILDMNIHKDGFLVLMTNTERILFGYGFAVLRSGYLFSPLIWISWTIQLTIIMFAYPNTSWSYSLFLMGLVSIRLSHFSCAVEDLEGVNGMNTHATSKRRKMAAFSRA